MVYILHEKSLYLVYIFTWNWSILFSLYLLKMSLYKNLGTLDYLGLCGILWEHWISSLSHTQVGPTEQNQIPNIDILFTGPIFFSIVLFLHIRHTSIWFLQDIYKGDLIYGVREQRRHALEKDRKNRKFSTDRNTYISNVIWSAFKKDLDKQKATNTNDEKWFQQCPFVINALYVDVAMYLLWWDFITCK